MKRLLFMIILALAAPSYAAEMLSVSAMQANVRSGPGAGYEVVWRAARFYPLEILDSQGGWIMVSDYENTEGWIRESLLSAEPAVVVIAKKANVREGPGAGYAVAWIVEKESSLKVLEADGNWYKVTDEDGLEGWINKSVTWGFGPEPELKEAEPM